MLLPGTTMRSMQMQLINPRLGKKFSFPEYATSGPVLMQWSAGKA